MSKRFTRPLGYPANRFALNIRIPMPQAGSSSGDSMPITPWELMLLVVAITVFLVLIGWIIWTTMEQCLYPNRNQGSTHYKVKRGVRDPPRCLELDVERVRQDEQNGVESSNLFIKASRRLGIAVGGATARFLRWIRGADERDDTYGGNWRDERWRLLREPRSSDCIRQGYEYGHRESCGDGASDSDRENVDASLELLGRTV